MNNQQTANMRYKKLPDSTLFKVYSPLQLLCNLTENHPQSATFHTADRYASCRQKRKRSITLKN